MKAKCPSCGMSGPLNYGCPTCPGFWFADEDSLWRDNYVQFARLLAELRGKIDAPLIQELCTETDLEPGDVEQVFNRAEIEWMRHKDGKGVRRFTPADEIEDFTS